MQWSVLGQVFSQIELTALRNQKTVLLAGLWKQLSSVEVAQVAYLAVGRLGPLYDPLEFGLAGKMVVRAVAWGVGMKPEHVEQEFKRVGDLGEVVGKIKVEARLQTVDSSVGEVYEELRGIAEERGAGSQERKVTRLGTLLKQLDPVGAKYVVRLVMGKLRLGFSDLTMLDSLSWASVGSKDDREVLEGAYNVWSDIGAVAQLYKEKGVVGLVELDVVPGRPVKPMRAERLGTTAEIIAKLGRCAVEPKLDGMRVQIHAFKNDKSQIRQFSNGEQNNLFEEINDDVVVRIFSRGLEDITHQFPEIVEAARELQTRVGDVVLDGEAIGVDKDTGANLAFQTTMTRKRKHGVGNKAEEVPLKVVVFDVLYAQGKGRLRDSYEERRSRLVGLGMRGVLTVAESHEVTTETELRALFDRYMQQKLEGVLVKRPESHYWAGARNFNWVKYKRAHEREMVDTIDCVVMGYYLGKGKRQKFGLGAFLVGVRAEERILTVGKVGTGLTDEQFGEMLNKLTSQQTKAKDERYEVPKSLVPDVWVSPAVIVEIQADEVTKSPVHTAGYALRFPRLARIREDKRVEDITTQAEVEVMSRI